MLYLDANLDVSVILGLFDFVTLIKHSLFTRSHTFCFQVTTLFYAMIQRFNSVTPCL